MLARPLAKYVVFSHCLLPSTLVVVCLGQVTDLTGIGAHLQANRRGARLVKTVNSCDGKTVGSFWGAVHAVHDSVVPIGDRYRLGHQPVISTWPDIGLCSLFCCFSSGSCKVSLCLFFSAPCHFCGWAGSCLSADLNLVVDLGVVVMAQCTVGRKVRTQQRIPHQV